MSDGPSGSDSDIGGVSPEEIPTPFLFKVMVVLTAVYLLYRLGQGVVWLFQVLSG